MSKTALLNAAAITTALAVANAAAAWTVNHSREHNSVKEILHQVSLSNPTDLIDETGEAAGASLKETRNSFGKTDFGRNFIKEEGRYEGSLLHSLTPTLKDSNSVGEAMDDYREMMIEIENDKKSKLNASWQPVNNYIVKDYLGELPNRFPGVDPVIIGEAVKKTEWEMFLNNKFRDMETVDALSDLHSRTIYGETGVIFTGILGRNDPVLKQVARDVTGSLVEEMTDRRHDSILVDGFLQGMHNKLSGLDKIRMDRATRITGEEMALMSAHAVRNDVELSDRDILGKSADTFVDCLAETGIQSDIITKARVIANDMVDRMLDGYDPYMDMDLDFGGKSGSSRTMFANAKEPELIGNPFPEPNPANISVDDLIENPFEKSGPPEVPAENSEKYENTIEI